MTAPSSHRLGAGAGIVSIDPATGTLDRVELDGRWYVVGQAGTSGLLRMAVPLPDYASHYLELGTHATPAIERVGDGLRLGYHRLSSVHAALNADITVDLTPKNDGLVLRAQVTNNGDQPIPQVAFPQLLGLESVGGTTGTRLQLARRRITPFTELAMRPDDAWWLNRRLQMYVPYGGKQFTMKWLDFGDSHGGLTVFSRNVRHTTQGLVLDRRDRDTELFDLRWVHYPFIGPGETWDSGEFVLLLHQGDWYAGARAYQRFTDQAYPYHAPTHLREALAIRSVWPAVRNSPPTFRFDRLIDYARELADPDLGVAELVLWHWWFRNGLPIIIDERLGTAEDLSAALAACRDVGVRVTMFASHTLVRTTDETDPAWRHLNAAQLPVEDNWTWGPDFLPRFQVKFMGTHVMVRSTPMSPGWRETVLAEYAKVLDYGARGMSFDMFDAPHDPEFSPDVDGRPDEGGVKLIELAQRIRELIHAHDPEGTFSGEFASDTKIPVLDYTWEWNQAYEMADAQPWRYVFPRFRLNANVNAHPRSALIAFMEGALLNLIPGDMRSHRLAAHPQLVAVIRRLAALRRRFLSYFIDGQFRSSEGLSVRGGDARGYSDGENVLLIAINPTNDPATVSLTVDPRSWGGAAGPRHATVYGLDGTVLQEAKEATATTTFEVGLGPDDLCLVELLAG